MPAGFSVNIPIHRNQQDHLDYMWCRHKYKMIRLKIGWCIIRSLYRSPNYCGPYKLTQTMKESGSFKISPHTIYTCVVLLRGDLFSMVSPVSSPMTVWSKVEKEWSNFKGWLHRWQTKLTCVVPAFPTSGRDDAMMLTLCQLLPQLR